MGLPIPITKRSVKGLMTIAAMAKRKGLRVRGVDNGTFVVTLPNGVGHVCKNLGDLRSWIKGY